MIEDLAQVVPIRVHGLDQAHLPGARPVLHVFLAPKGLRFLARHPIKARTFARRGEYRYPTNFGRLPRGKTVASLDFAGGAPKYQ